MGKLTEINIRDLEEGDTVGVAYAVHLGGNYFRYPQIKSMKIARLSPRKHKVVMTNGMVFNRGEEPLYELDREAERQDSVTTAAQNMREKLKLFCTWAKDGSLYRVKDDTIVQISNMFDFIVEEVRKEQYRND
jgi:hypothetical protein